MSYPTIESAKRPLLVFLNEVAGGRKLLQAVRERQDQVSEVIVAAPQNQPTIGQLIDRDEPTPRRVLGSR